MDTLTRMGTAFRVEVTARAAPPDAHGIAGCRASALYFLQGDLSAADVDRLCQQLLADPVTETYQALRVEDAAARQRDASRDTAYVEITLLPGVTDPAAENLVRAAHLLGVTALERAASGRRYVLPAGTHDLHHLAVDVFANPVIQRFSLNMPIAPPFVAAHESDGLVETIGLRAADDGELLAVSKQRRLSLDADEMRAVRDYFRAEGRDPTDVELETLAQTWSEHCVHKTFKARIDYTDANGTTRIDGLLGTYIRAATEQVNKAFVRSAFVDNAGIVAFDETFDLAFKVETHNHPSALEPFGGANTGVGGVVRDVLGVSARPIANTDVLCFGPPDMPQEALPSGVLHPARIAEGVIAGIEDYGNKMGIPTVNGAVLYDRGYAANPLVFCGCLGILPHGAHPRGARPGDLIVVVGGRTGRDGLRGATFSSMEMDTGTADIASVSVQIGHPIHEKQVQEAVLRARDERLYNAITDCGAGGLSSAVGEMGADTGARVRLETVPLKYPGLRPWEIWLSEAQERVVLAVPPDHWARVQQICAGQDIEAVCIGVFEPTGRLTLTYHGRVVGDVTMRFLHDGIPTRHLKAEWRAPTAAAPPLPRVSVKEALLKLLAHPTIRSKEHIVRLYDHEVQGGGAVKPFVGVDNHGPSDAAVLVPLDTQLRAPDAPPTKGVALSAGINPAYGDLDPRAMAWAAVDEAFRNLVAVGADPDQVALLDNFCWGSPALPDRLGALVRCAQGCYEAALAYQAPFVSGKDSLNNEYADADGTRHAIPGTLLISALGIVPDVRQTVTMDVKQAGSHLYLVGETRAELGGSHLHLLHGIPGGTPPAPVPHALDLMRRLHRAMQSGLVRACHDLSEGGLAVALAEMCIAGRLGANVWLGDSPSTLVCLFAESSARWIVEVAPGDVAAFEALLAGVPHTALGVVVQAPVLKIGHGDTVVLEVPIAALEAAWRGHVLTPAEPGEPLPSGNYSHSQKKVTPRVPAVHTGAPRVLILHANGTNRDREAALACRLAGGAPEIVHVNQLLDGKRALLDYHMLVIPGGFSYGDDLGAGTLWALDLRHRLGVDVARFIAEGRPVLGICNGFQTLVKAGFLPGEAFGGAQRVVTLARNRRQHFECRWVYLQSNSHSQCLFTEGLGEENIYCPVAHGEGRVAAASPAAAEALWSQGLAPLVYADAGGSPSEGTSAPYPLTPNGSLYGIAALTNPAGNVLGLMPHPEDHVFAWQHPRWHRGARGGDGLRLFRNGIRFA